eukprot:3242400-Pyramimonas_sp.AAC.1
MVVGTIDVKDAFFQYFADEVASWFGLGHEVAAKDWRVTWVWGDDLRRFDAVGLAEELEVVFEAMCIGWTWALYLCSGGIESCLSGAGLAVMKGRAPILVTW